MALLARRVKGRLWANAQDVQVWRRPNYPYQLLTDLIDKEGGGISVWEVASRTDPNLKRIAAALTVGNKQNPGNEISDIEFRFADLAKVSALGIKAINTSGDTRDKEVNKLHRELVELTAAQAVALLRMMNKKERIFSAKEIAKFVAKGIARGELEDALNQKLLWALHQKNAVKIVASKKSK